MAKTKRPQYKYPTTKTAGPAASRPALSAPVDLVDYALLNGIFIAFCMVQLVIVRMLLPDMLGLYFFFGFLIVAFALVSVFDYLAGRIITDEGEMEVKQT